MNFSCGLWNCILKEELPPLLLSYFSLFFFFFSFPPSICSAGPQEAHEHTELPTEVVT